MDLRTQLLKEHGRANADLIAEHVGDDPERFAELMQCMLSTEVRIAQRAAFSVGIVGERHPQLTTPYLARMLKALERPVHPAIPRNVIRILQHCDLPKALHGRIIEAMFQRIAEPRHPIAERAFAISVAARLVQRHAGLAAEFRLLLERTLQACPSAAVRSRVNKALKAPGMPPSASPE